MKMEIRNLTSWPGVPQIVDGASGKGSRIVGYAAVYGSLSEDLGEFREEIEPGTFNRALARGNDVLAVIDHDESRLLGRRSSGTLQLQADSRGLKYTIDTPDTSIARDLLVMLRRRDYRGSSFKFRVVKDRWERRFIGGEQKRVRILSDLILSDVCPVVNPAYPQTSVYAERQGVTRISAQMQLNANRLRLAEAELVGGR